MKEILVVCETLKQADDLFRRSVALLQPSSSVKFHKNRREIIILNVQSIRFTSEKYYETRDQYGFIGRIIYGRDYDRDLEREEMYYRSMKENLRSDSEVK